jgi:membrane-associated phospholipid phosphatase
MSHNEDEKPGEVGPFGPAVDTFDSLVDGWFEPLRANPITDRVFYAASSLGDFSLIWHVVGAWKALLPGGRPSDATRLSMVMAVESVVVNQGVKRLFGRVRPSRAAAGDRQIRQPITSSFPSGHASAAMTAAAVLSRRSRFGVVYYVIGGIVATSRIHVKMHHASDVVAGAATGVLIGRVARVLLGTVEKS